MSAEHSSTEPQSEEQINNIADSLTTGNRVLFNDRAMPLEVVSRHKKPITKAYRRRAGTRDHYDIVVLEGNGTEYHLLWQHGSGHTPILRRRSQWSETETDDGEVEYDYSAQGDRIFFIEVVEDEADGQ